MATPQQQPVPGTPGGGVKEEPLDSTLEIGDISRLLFTQVGWSEYIKSGMFLSQNEVLGYFIYFYTKIEFVHCSFS